MAIESSMEDVSKDEDISFSYIQIHSFVELTYSFHELLILLDTEAFTNQLEYFITSVSNEKQQF